MPGLFAGCSHELFDRRLARLINVFTLEGFPESYAKNLEVKPERKMVNIPYIKLELLYPPDGVSAIDLRPSCNSGYCFVASKLLTSVAAAIVCIKRARPHKAHFAGEDVDQLWKFIKTRRTQKRSQVRQSLGIWQQVSMNISRVCHRTKFSDEEGLSSEAQSFLFEQYRPAESEPNDERYDSHEY